MALTFYPYEEDIAQKGSIKERLEILTEAADRYKAVILDQATKAEASGERLRIPESPSILTTAFNWDGIAKLLREIREMPESTPVNKIEKSENLKKLSEIYEVLRAAKMPKLEAVRLALINEADQIRGGASRVA